MDTLNFDWGKYGALVKGRRKCKASTADEFARLIFLRTRTKISRDALYRIEQGKQVPNAAQFMAINLALFGEALPSGRTGLQPCFSDEWFDYNKTGTVPRNWRKENASHLYEERGFVSDTGLMVIRDVYLREGDFLGRDDYFDHADCFVVFKDGKEKGLAFAEFAGFYFAYDRAICSDLLGWELSDPLPTEFEN